MALYFSCLRMQVMNAAECPTRRYSSLGRSRIQAKTTRAAVSTEMINQDEMSRLFRSAPSLNLAPSPLNRVPLTTRDFSATPIR